MFGIPWHRLLISLSLLEVARFDNKLRQENLQLPNQDKLSKPNPYPDEHHLVSRLQMAATMT